MANNTRNGYEIRADLLGLAKQIAEFNYSIKYNEYEQSVRKEGDQVVTEFKYPSITPEVIIATAQKFNEFVTNGASIGENTQMLMENVKKFNEKVQESIKPESIQENFKAYQQNVQKFTEAFFNGVSKK
jgi:gas vesicle protein